MHHLHAHPRDVRREHLFQHVHRNAFLHYEYPQREHRECCVRFRVHRRVRRVHRQPWPVLQLP